MSFYHKVSINGYNECYTPCNSNKGGCALYVKEMYAVFWKKRS